MRITQAINTTKTGRLCSWSSLCCANWCVLYMERSVHQN